jgi:hypothetical protein
MAAVIYTLCALTCLACAILLLRGYLASKATLLLYSGLCFSGLALSNALLVIDRFVLGEEVSLLGLRLATAFVAMMLLLFGLIWEHD